MVIGRKPTICICENKDADQLRDKREADQRLCFCGNREADQRLCYSSVCVAKKKKKCGDWNLDRFCCNLQRGNELICIGSFPVHQASNHCTPFGHALCDVASVCAVRIMSIWGIVFTNESCASNQISGSKSSMHNNDV